VTTREQLKKNGYELREGLAGVSEEIEAIAYGIEGVADGIDRLTGKSDWAFGEILVILGAVRASLQELVAVAKTPMETWAYEQFRYAREAMAQQLHPEAHEALLHAISGLGSHLGYELEYRFHYTLGVLHLGDCADHEAALVDLDKAGSGVPRRGAVCAKAFPARGGGGADGGGARGVLPGSGGDADGGGARGVLPGSGGDGEGAGGAGHRDLERTSRESFPRGQGAVRAGQARPRGGRSYGGDSAGCGLCGKSCDGA